MLMEFMGRVPVITKAPELYLLKECISLRISIVYLILICGQFSLCKLLQLGWVILGLVYRVELKGQIILYRCDFGFIIKRIVLECIDHALDNVGPILFINQSLFDEVKFNSLHVFNQENQGVQNIIYLRVGI